MLSFAFCVRLPSSISGIAARAHTTPHSLIATPRFQFEVPHVQLVSLPFDIAPLSPDASSVLARTRCRIVRFQVQLTNNKIMGPHGYRYVLMDLMLNGHA